MKANAQDPTQVFNARLLVHSARGDVTTCAQELAEMDAQGVARDEVTYLRVVEVYVRAGDVATARAILEEMAASGFVVDNAAHCVMLSAYAQRGDLRACEQLVEEMRMQGMRPNAAAYAHWIDALCAAQDVDGALRVLDEMRAQDMKITLAIWARVSEVAWGIPRKRGKVFEKIKESDDVSPTQVYVVLMEMEEKRRKWEKVLDLAQDLRARREECDYAVYAKIAKAHEQRGNAETWLKVVNEARARGFHLPIPAALFLALARNVDITTCARLYEMMNEGEKESEKDGKASEKESGESIKEREEQDKEVEKGSAKAPAKVRKVMADIWVEAGSVQNAQKIVEEMRKEGQKPNPGLLDKMIKEVYKKARWDSCVEFFAYFQIFAISPPFSTLEMMIVVFGVKKDIDAARKLWAEAKKRGEEGEREREGEGRIDSAMVYAYAMTGDAKNAKEIFGKMREKKIEANEIAYTGLISLLGKKGELGEVGKLYEEVLEKRIEHGEKLNNAVLVAFASHGREREGKEGELSLVGLLGRHKEREEVKRFVDVLKSLKIM